MYKSSLYLGYSPALSTDYQVFPGITFHYLQPLLPFLFLVLYPQLNVPSFHPSNIPSSSVSLGAFSYFFCLEHLTQIFQLLVSFCHLGLSQNQISFTIQSKLIISLHSHSLSCFFFSQINPPDFIFICLCTYQYLSSLPECEFCESRMLSRLLTNLVLVMNRRVPYK